MLNVALRSRRVAFLVWAGCDFRHNTFRHLEVEVSFALEVNLKRNETPPQVHPQLTNAFAWETIFGAAVGGAVNALSMPADDGVYGTTSVGCRGGSRYVEG